MIDECRVDYRGLVARGRDHTVTGWIECNGIDVVAVMRVSNRQQAVVLQIPEIKPSLQRRRHQQVFRRMERSAHHPFVCFVTERRTHQGAIGDVPDSSGLIIGDRNGPLARGIEGSPIYALAMGVCRAENSNLPAGSGVPDSRPLIMLGGQDQFARWTERGREGFFRMLKDDVERPSGRSVEQARFGSGHRDHALAGRIE